MPKKILNCVFAILLIAFSACRPAKKNTLFTLQDNGELGVDFVNIVTETDQTNVFTFRNFYNGGGVAMGDVNNDGLNDVFLTSNQHGNQLYINQGNWKYKKVTHAAGVEGTKFWSTGATMVDINGDGWLDIYVCHSGNAPGDLRGNELTSITVLLKKRPKSTVWLTADYQHKRYFLIWTTMAIWIVLC